MAYRFLKLDPIPPYVSDRLNLYKNNKEVSKLGVWVKLTSSAGEESLGESRAGLTIVSNPNIPTFGMSSIHGSLDVDAPIGSKSFDGNIQSYEGRGREGTGFRPRPIIETITITNGSRGLSRKAEFTITCYTQSQADEISRYFLEPGFTLCIEWGWNVPKSYQEVSRNLREIAALQNFDEIENRRVNSDGTYDAYYGVITGGGMTNSDGKYNVSVKCAGMGEVFSMIQTHKNSTIGDETDEPEQTGISLKHNRETESNETDSFVYMFNDLPDVWRTKKVSKLINDPDVSHHTHFINFIPSVPEALNKRTKSAGTLKRIVTFGRAGTVDTNEGRIRIPSGNGIVSGQRYVRFGVLMKILNSGLYDYEQGVKMKNGRYTSLSINTHNVPISGFVRMFSVDGSKVYIPNKYIPDFGLSTSFTNDTGTNTFSDIAKSSTLSLRYNPEFDGSPIYNEFPRGERLSDGELDAEPYSYGYLDDLYINFEFALSVLGRKGLAIKDVMYELLNGMSSAVNNYWDFQIVEDTDDDGQLVLSVVDYNFTGFKEKEPLEIVSVGTESPFESFSFEVDIPGAMMNQVIGRRLTEDKIDPQDELERLPNRLFGDGVIFKDFVIGVLDKDDENSDSQDETDPPLDDQTEAEFDSDEQKLRNFEFFMKRATVIPTVTSRKSPLFIDSKTTDEYNIEGDIVSRAISPLDFVFCCAWEDTKLFTELRAQSTGGQVSNNNLSPLLPITTNWSTFGISGLRNGLTYKILDLPQKYRGIGLFQITEITHTISGMKWSTSVEGKFRQSSE